jgi:uncharacterized protein
LADNSVIVHPVIIGRESEIDILQGLLRSRESELLALYGRRRVGKTFLIRTYYANEIIFSCSGQFMGKKQEQLINFMHQLNSHFPDRKIAFPPTTWQLAFQQLEESIDSIKHKRKKVLFFDELPWLDNQKSGFLSAFSYFWNMYATQRTDLVVVICGSAASWIIAKVINNKGGLHNRVTSRMRLMPFNLQETEYYLKQRNINLDRYQLQQLYMIMGGVPLYLNAVRRGKSAAQTIDDTCFSKDGILSNEFNNLYTALFNSPEKHIQVIRALALKNKGLTRTELLAVAKLVTGGAMTMVLNELTESGFVEKIYPFENQEKNALYRLADEYSLFYIKFMEQTKPVGKGEWLNIMTTPAYKTWCGYAFENICFRHLLQIKKALQIAGVQSSAFSWYKAGTANEDGAQVDLLFDRADHCINICEIKFSATPFTIDKRYAEQMKKKLMVFNAETKTRKTVIRTFITTYGLVNNDYKIQCADAEITMNDLFV